MRTLLGYLILIVGGAVLIAAVIGGIIMFVIGFLFLVQILAAMIQGFASVL
jgi:hypothetical protein